MKLLLIFLLLMANVAMADSKITLELTKCYYVANHSTSDVYMYIGADERGPRGFYISEDGRTRVMNLKHYGSKLRACPCPTGLQYTASK